MQLTTSFMENGININDLESTLKDGDFSCLNGW